MDLNTFTLVKELKEYIEDKARELEKSRVVDVYRSSELKDLNLALSKAQGSFPKIYYNREAPYFKKEYSDLNSILTPIRSILRDNELALRQWAELKEGGETILHTELSHSSGQWVESRARVLPPKNDPLSFTSTKNQIKATEILSLLSLTVCDDPLDDNAEIQLADDRHIIAKGSQGKLIYNPRERSTECISNDQLDMLEKELVSCPDFVEEIFKGADIQSLADLPRNKFDFTITKIRKVNELRSGKRPNAN